MPPSAGKAQLFPDRDYGGEATTLEEGTHNLGTGGNGAVSSLKVAPGYAVTVYSGSDGHGASATFTADTAYAGATFSGHVRSVEVSAAEATPAAPDWFDEGRSPGLF